MKTISNWFGCVLLALALVGVGCSGDEGNDGKDGAPGANGDAGATGAKGAEGAKGAMGAMGATGAMGAKGADGADGADGDAGVDGDDGAMGAMGTMGVSGIIDRTKLTGKSTIYQLVATQTSGVNGDVRFAEFVDGTTVGTLVTIRITGNSMAIVADTIRAAHIHYNTVAATGSAAVTLNKVDGFTADGTGISETLVTKVDAAAINAADGAEVFVSGAAINYAQLTGDGTPANGFNGYVNVHTIAADTVATNPGAVTAGNIGKN